MTDRFVIRKATPYDAVELLQYLKIVGSETDFLSFGKEGIGLTVTQEKDFLLKNICFVAYENDRIVASATAIQEQRRHSHVFVLGISVLQEYWGHGLGGTIIDKIIEEVKKIGGKKIILHVNATNKRAISLYIKKGFIVEGCLKNYANINDKFYDGYIMSLFV